jgi:hypothetical protein
MDHLGDRLHAEHKLNNRSIILYQAAAELPVFNRDGCVKDRRLMGELCFTLPGNSLCT